MEASRVFRYASSDVAALRSYLKRIPFGATDPRLDKQQKLHKSLIRHDNEFMLTDLETQESTNKGNT